MKITIYTTVDCPFSQTEKEYLTKHGLAYEEKDVEQNRTYLSEMIAISENFAGVPFTVVTKDDGTLIKLHGFTPTEFDTALGVMSAAPTVPPATVPPIASSLSQAAGLPVSVAPPVQPATKPLTPTLSSPAGLPTNTAPVQTMAPPLTVAPFIPASQSANPTASPVPAIPSPVITVPNQADTTNISAPTPVTAPSAANSNLASATTTKPDQLKSILNNLDSLSNGGNEQSKQTTPTEPAQPVAVPTPATTPIPPMASGTQLTDKI